MPRKATPTVNPRDRERTALCSETQIPSVGGGRGGQKIGCYFHCWQFRFRGISSAVPSSVELNKSSSSNRGKRGWGRGRQHLQLNAKRQAACKRASSAWNKSPGSPRASILLKQDIATVKQNTDQNPSTLAAPGNCCQCAPPSRAGCVDCDVKERRWRTWLPWQLPIVWAAEEQAHFICAVPENGCVRKD